jgi:DNA (cytosine-5)-methyltransferase 1
MRVWSFFSGAGGLDLGLSRAGLEPELAVEVDPVFCSTLRESFPHTRVIETDVHKVTPATLPTDGEIDLMVGGPPCQSFCPGGKRAALSDPRGNLIFEYLRLVRELQPRAFILENVANLVTAALRHRPIAERPGKNWNLSAYSRQTAIDPDGPPPLAPDELSGSAITYLAEVLAETMKYSFTVGVLDAASYGAPQHRLRLLLIGVREGKAPPLPSPTHGLGLAPYRTVRGSIGDIVSDPGPGSAYTPEVRAVFELVPEGGNWRSLPEDVARKALGERSYAAGGGKTGFFRRLAWDAPSPTITGRSNRKGSALCHPSQSRPLSVRECQRIQDFPDNWGFVGSVAAQYQQVGNAVPVALGEAIGQPVLSYLNGAAEVETRSMQDMIADATSKLRATARNKRNRGGDGSPA